MSPGAEWIVPAGSVQARVLDFVRGRCGVGEVSGSAAGLGEASVEVAAGRAAAAVQGGAPRTAAPPTVTVNFHPDRRTAEGVPVLEALATDGLLRSQFETGTSNGGLTAHPGGDRWTWEHRAFGGLYDDADPAERPKYGALEHRGRASGASPRFGSAVLRLRPQVLSRTTFCYPDSYFAPTDFGVAETIGHLVALAEAGDLDLLDRYVEAHVHGPVRLAEDVEALVLDPCFRGTAVERRARELPCPLAWHEGFRLDLAVIEAHPEYRGPEIVQLARSLAREGQLDPAMLGEAVEQGHHDPQAVKEVWHHLARFGDQSRG